MNSNTKIETNNNGMSICIPRAFANINEARVRKVFDKLGIFTIARVDMIQRKNEKGDAYQRIFVHIQDWTETADAQKARDRLLAGKELKIVYDDPWFWKASLNTWAPKPKPEPTVYDRKPRIRLEFEEEDNCKKNTDAATQLLSNMTLEDRRPYSERRLDPVYCEQDVKSGFRDRREPKKEQRKSRFTPRSPSRSPPRTNRKNEFEKPVITQPKPQKKSAAVIQLVEEPVIQEKVAFKMNPDIRLMVATFHGIGRDEVTEELYKNTSQFVRDLRQDDMDRQKDEDAAAGIKPLNYGVPANPPKRKSRNIIAEEKTDV
jgi:hypothetical protein